MVMEIKYLGYDQNRAGLKEWVDAMYKDEASSKYFDGTAIHWYESTYEFFLKHCNMHTIKLQINI